MAASHFVNTSVVIGGLVVCTIVSFMLTGVVLHHSLNQVQTQHSTHGDLSILDAIDTTTQERRREIVDPSTLDKFKRLKYEYETRYPPSDRKRIHDYVNGLRRNSYQTQPNMPYDIHNCPSAPPQGYPMAWNVMDVIGNWNPHDTSLPEPKRIFQGLCIFDWEKDYETAQRYREAEVPFVIQNNPELMKTSERWNRKDGHYLFDILRNEKYKTEYSKNAHMMYWKKRMNQPAGWKPPTEITKLSFGEWLEKAESIERYENQADKEHWYLRINAAYKGNSGFMYNELPMFTPKKPSFFMVDPKQQRGINCRFGMKGVIAETHYDQSRNFIMLMGGERRYILAHPNQCENMALYPQGHPSGRHSAVNWSNPDLNAFPEFGNAQVNEVVLQAGDAMYLPTYWFHFIVSLNTNYQCNARSGTTYEYQNEIKKCGFGR